MEVPMAFSYTNKGGTTYYLHERVSSTKSGAKRTLYFFSKEKKAGVLDAVPNGYKVAETKNGLPVLKKG